MLRRFVIAAGLCGSILWPAAASAQQEREGPPAAFTRALQCRAITAPEERLACYDREIAALEQAERTSQIRVVDAQQVRRTRRTLFGLNLQDFNIFGGGGGEDAVNEIEATLRSASQNALGRWTFVLDDGARWQQMDNVDIFPEPGTGSTIRIRRGAMGSYLANVNRARAVRVRRQN